MRALLTLLVTALFAGACRDPRLTGPWTDEPEPEVERDLADVLDDGVLQVGLRSDPTSWFLDRGVPMGLEHDLMEAFAEHLDVELELVRVRDLAEACEWLRNGELDWISGRLLEPSTPCGAASEPLYHIEPAIVQRAQPDGGVLVDDLTELEGRKVWLRRGSPWASRIDHAELRFIDGSAYAEELVRRVHHDRIPRALVPADIAMLEASFLRNIRVRPVFGPALPVVGVTRDSSPDLRHTFDDWLMRHDRLRRELYGTYLVDRRGRSRAPLDLSLVADRLSDFDEIFQDHADVVGWRWTLLAAMAWKESTFNPNARSWAGAKGLMQLMPATAEEVGVRDPYDPDQGVAGAARYLNGLQARWSHVDGDDRTALVLASYNAGAGHVEDAARLAEASGGDPTQWSDVAPWLLELEEARVNVLPVVQHGYCRGSETVHYVDTILNLERRYAALLHQEPKVHMP